MEHPKRQTSGFADALAPLEDRTRQILTVSQDTRTAVKRLDARDRRMRKSTRLTFDVDTQERVFALWETGRTNPEVKRCAPNGRKVTYAIVFDYYVRDFRALGIASATSLRACLGARSDRLRRAKRSG